MKLGDRSIIYQHGSVGEKNEYFGISKFEGTFFDRAVENGVIKRMEAWIFGWCRWGRWCRQGFEVVNTGMKRAV